MAALPWNQRQLSPGIGGRLVMESVAAFARNRWQLSRGIGGSLRVESVAGFTWNRWQLSRGIRTAGLDAVHAQLQCYITLEQLDAGNARRDCDDTDIVDVEAEEVGAPEVAALPSPTDDAEAEKTLWERVRKISFGRQEKS
jgi:hypothetical protein